MDSSVVIKGSKNGITILINSPMRYDELLEVLKDKFSRGKDFFKDSSMALQIKGMHLTQRQEIEIIHLIEEYSDMKIICLVDDNEVTNARFLKSIREREYLKHIENGLILRGTLHAGQCFETKKSAILLGSVEAGAKLVSGGNIIILGALYGEAYAGLDNGNSSYIIALDMKPQYLKIETHYAKHSNQFHRFRKNGPKIAYISRGKICINSLTI
ncbi:MAG: septum site-determining protein MinC [Lachnospiraceae bacterium]